MARYDALVIGFVLIMICVLFAAYAEIVDDEDIEEDEDEG